MRVRLDDERGFSLLETLVALFVMIAAATLLYRGFSDGLVTSKTVDSQQIALDVAKSRLAMVGTAIPLAPGRHEGTDNGNITWTLDIRPYSPDEAASTSTPVPPGVPAYWATISVAWRDRGARTPRNLRLTTLKLGTAR